MHFLHLEAFQPQFRTSRLIWGCAFLFILIFKKHLPLLWLTIHSVSVKVGGR
jgi:hypothetical protein